MCITLQTGLGSIKKELELINSNSIPEFGAEIGIERFGTKFIELEFRDFELNKMELSI